MSHVQCSIPCVGPARLMNVCVLPPLPRMQRWRSLRRAASTTAGQRNTGASSSSIYDLQRLHHLSKAGRLQCPLPATSVASTASKVFDKMSSPNTGSCTVLYFYPMLQTSRLRLVYWTKSLPNYRFLHHFLLQTTDFNHSNQLKKIQSSLALM